MNLLLLLIIIIFILILIKYNNTPIDIKQANKKNIEENIINKQNILNDKINKIKPYLKPNIDINPNEYKYDLKTDVNLYNYDDIFEFIVNTQDFYHDNENAYEQFIYELKTFMKVYEILLVDPSYTNLYYPILKDKRQNILNHFNSIKIKCKLDENNINQVVSDLKEIIDRYYNTIIKLHEDNIKMYGYTNKTYVIDKSNINPYNDYNKYTSTFNIY